MSETIKYALLGIAGMIAGFLAHQTDEPITRLEDGGTPFRWTQNSRNVVGFVLTAFVLLLYWEERPYTFSEKLGVLSQVGINVGLGVTFGHYIDEAYGKPRYEGGAKRWPVWD